MSSDPWGRVADDGTVYVRTADGERRVGSWHAGSPEDALAFFHRKYDALVLEVDLLEKRLGDRHLSPDDAEKVIQRLRDTVTTADAVGDLDGLTSRLTALTSVVDAQREDRAAARARAVEESRAAKERIVEEAERLAQTSSQWRESGERLRVLVEEWKTLRRLDRRTDESLWQRFSAARTTFARRRKAHFAELESRREEAGAVKEKLVAEAETLAGSTDWGATAARFRALMRDWKAAGRAPREVDDTLWRRFKAAQDTFFAARSAVFAERDAGQRENLVHKEELAAEAEALLPVTDVRAARAALRSIHERWEEVGHVPRDARHALESRLARVDQAVRQAEDARWRRSNPEAVARASTTVAQLRTSIDQLESDLATARAKADDDEVRRVEESLEARRSWLVEAERTLTEFAGE